MLVLVTSLCLAFSDADIEFDFVFIGGFGVRQGGHPPKTPKVALCPVELRNVALSMAPRMHQNMQLETQQFQKFLRSAPSPARVPR